MVKVYGADWCGDTKKAISYLDSTGIDYQYINVENDVEASEWVKSQNNGKERKPTIKIGEKILSVPSEDELADVLEKEGLAANLK